MIATFSFVSSIYFIYSINDMGKYVYIDKDSKKGRFGIGVGVFEVLANDALQRVPGLVTDSDESNHRHKPKLNSSEVSIHHGVVYVKVKITAKNSVDVKKLESDIIEAINTAFMMVAEQIPTEVKVKVENIL